MRTPLTPLLIAGFRTATIAVATLASTGPFSEMLFTASIVAVRIGAGPEFSGSA
jgi:hypothetical protein